MKNKETEIYVNEKTAQRIELFDGKGEYAEVHIDFFDDICQCWCVDAWKTPIDDEEGCVVAEIYLDGTINWNEPTAKNDSLINEAIKEFFKEKLTPDYA